MALFFKTVKGKRMLCATGRKPKTSRYSIDSLMGDYAIIRSDRFRMDELTLSGGLMRVWFDDREVARFVLPDGLEEGFPAH